MTEIVLEAMAASARAGAAYRDNVIPDLAAWRRDGERCALVTLVGVDGNAPRAAGAQMAVSESGRFAGYISGGCLEQAIALEAAEAIEAGKPRLLRYGKGSPYFDIRLPCGSGLDVFIQPMHDIALIEEMAGRLLRRRPFALRIELATGEALLEEAGERQPLSHRDGASFVRAYGPALRCLVIGSSPIALALSALAACAGFETHFYSPGPEKAPALPGAVSLHPLAPRTAFAADAWTAAALAFHDHDQELPVFAALLRSPCFFIGAIGSRNAHAARKLALAGLDFSEAEIARIASPTGLVAGLKTAPFIAVSVLAQIVEAAREKRLIS
ncbi:MAG: XdhC family protein [Rhodomicrobium sp.]